MMGIADIDLSLKPRDLELFLAKQNREIIAKLSNAYSKSQTMKLGNINEITFSLPYDVEFDHKLVRNKDIDKVMDRYLVKAKVDTQEEWYIIRSIVETMDDGQDVKEVTAYLLPYEMNDKLVRSFQEDGLNLTQVLTGGAIRTDENGDTYTTYGVLDSTKWTLGYVDADFDTKFRSFDFTSVTVLDAVFQIAETFKALIVWDTEDRKINFYNPDNYGLNRGLKISYGHYLKSLSKESNSDEMVTRLKVEGSDGLTISKVNPTGLSYIEDFSYFLYPFARKKVNESNGQDWDNVSPWVWMTTNYSNYMSEDLCHALLDYKEFADSKKNEFNTLLTQKLGYQTTLTTKQNELSTLQEELSVIQNSIDIENAAGNSTTALVAQKTTKTGQITSKNSEIASVNAQITTVNNNIATLRDSLDSSNFLTTDMMIELNDYIIEKEWVDGNYINEQELYNDAIKYYEKIREPQVVISIDAVNLLSVIEAQRDWDKIVLGDTIIINYEKLSVNVTAKIIEVSINYEDGSMALTIANTKDILTDEEKLFKMLYNSTGTSTTVDMSKTKWDYANATASRVSGIIDSTWDAIAREIKAGVNESVEISERGILIKDPTDPMRYLVAQHGVLGLTNDGGNTWKNAITPEGIVAERLFGKVVAGVNLTIDASDAGGTKLLTVDGNGVTVAGTTFKITGGTNGVVLDPTTGLTITKSNNTIRTVLNATDGFRFQKSTDNGATWTDKLSYDATSGNLVVDGSINARELKINNVNVIAGNKIGGQYIDTATIQNLVVGNNVTMGANAYIAWANVTGTPSIPTTTDINNIASTRITSTLVSAPLIQGATIQGGTISSNAQIDVGTNLYVGDNIYLTRGSSGVQNIVSAGTGSITFNNNLVRISASSQIDLQASVVTINGTAMSATAKFG